MKRLLFLMICLFPAVCLGDNQSVVVQRKIITDNGRVKVIAVPVAESYYYQVNQGKVEELNKEKLAQDVADKVIDELSKILEEILKGLGDKPSNPDPAPKPEPDPVPQPKPDDLDKQVLNIFVKYKCNTCHNENKKQKNVQLTQGNNLANISDVTKFRVYYSVIKGQMPPTNTKLTDDEVELLGAWANQKWESGE